MKTDALVSSLVFLLMAGCATPPPQTIPEGFAQFEDEDAVRAISPEGIVFRVRTERNAPDADGDFWKEAVRTHMLRSGYRLQSEGELQVRSGWKGAYLELAAPMRNGDVKYLVGFLMRQEDIVIVEAGGEVLGFEKRRASILKAIENF